MSQLCLFLSSDEPLQPLGADEMAAPTPQHPVVLMAMASVAIGTSGARENKEHLYQALAHLLQKRWALARPRIVGAVVAAAVSAALCEIPEAFSRHFTADCVAGADVLPTSDEAANADFHSTPAMPLQQFLKRLHRGIKCSAECFPIALVLLDRFYRATHERIDKSSAPRLLLVSLLIATKLRDDRFYKNSAWADVSGVPLTVLNALEIKFLSAVRYDVFVEADEYLEFEGIVLDTIAQFTEDDEGFAAASAALTPSSSSPQIASLGLVRTKIGSMGLTPLATPSSVTPMRSRLGQTVGLTASHDSYGPEGGDSAMQTPQGPPAKGIDKLSLLLGNPISARPV